MSRFLLDFTEENLEYLTYYSQVHEVLKRLKEGKIKKVKKAIRFVEKRLRDLKARKEVGV